MSLVPAERPWDRSAVPALGITLIATVCGLLAYTATRMPGGALSDIEPLWLAARALRAGQNPYEVIRSTQVFPLFYPLPAVLLVLPFSYLSFAAVRVLWAVLSGAAFAAAGCRRGKALLAGLLGAQFLCGLMYGQWSPLLTAGAVFPALAMTWAAKPSAGLALFAAYGNRRAFAWAAALTFLSLAVMPTWPVHWLEAIRSQPYKAPVVRPFGWILLLAFLKWRTPEGRLLGVLACVPQTTAVYETLPIFLVSPNRWVSYGLVVLGMINAVWGRAIALPWDWTAATFPAVVDHEWIPLLVCTYLPALVVVLCLRKKPI